MRTVAQVASAVAVLALLTFGLVQPASAATSHDYQWANGTTQLTASPGDLIEVDLTISGCDDGSVINGQGFTLLGWLGNYDLQLPVAPGYANGTASFGPQWPLVTVAPTPLENTTYRIPFQIPEDQELGATKFRMTNYQGVSCSASGGVGPQIDLTIVAESAPTVAGAPVELDGTPGDGEVELSWSAPASDGGSPVTGYRMEVATSAEGPFSGASSGCDAPGIGSSVATSCTAAALDNGTSYYFRALAFNDIGSGAYSDVAGPFVPVPSPPGTPAAPTATAGDQEATVTVAASETGGAPESFTVTADPGGAVCKVVGSSGSCTVTGLTNGVAHTFTAVASNSGGTSSPSPASAPVTPTAPEAPPESPSPEPPAPTPPASPGPTLPRVGPSELSLSFNLDIGSPVGDPTNTVGVAGSGLVAGSEFTITMFSTPRQLDRGVVAADGALARTVSIPSDTEPGAHRITVEAIGTDGPVTASGWFSVDQDGRIAAVSSTGPVDDPTATGSVAAPIRSSADAAPSSLAFTGSDGAPLIGLAGPLLLAGIVLTLVGRRRDRTA